MARFIRQQSSCRSVVSRVSAILVALGFSASGAVLPAAPVTLRFNATIGPPNVGDNPINLPFSFAEGDLVEARLTCEPINVPSNVQLTTSNQQFSVEFQINGFSFGSSRYNLIAVDNTSITTEPGDIDPPPQDGVALNCDMGGENTCEPKSIDGAGSAEFEFFLRLVGNEGVIDGADIPGDPAIWNSFVTERMLRINFREPETTEFYEINATVNLFASVPEPGCIMSSAGALLLGACRRRRRTEV